MWLDLYLTLILKGSTKQNTYQLVKIICKTEVQLYLNPPLVFTCVTLSCVMYYYLEKMNYGNNSKGSWKKR